MMERFFAGMFLEGSDAAVKDRIVRRALALPEAIGAALFARLACWDAQYLDTAFQRVAVPLLVIQSTYLNPQQVRVPLQPGATTPWIELIRRAVPTVHNEIVGGAGHFTMLDKPAVVNQLLDAFVAHVGRSAA